MNVENVVATLGGDATPFLNEIRKMKQAVKDLAASVKADLGQLTGELENQGISSFKKAGSEHKAAFGDIKKQINEATEAYKDLNREIKSNMYVSRTGEKAGGLRDIKDTLDNIKQSAKEAGNSVRIFAHELDGAGKMAEQAMNNAVRGIASMMRARANAISSGSLMTGLDPRDTMGYQSATFRSSGLNIGRIGGPPPYIPSPNTAVPHTGSFPLVSSPNPYGYDFRQLFGIGGMGTDSFRRGSGGGSSGGPDPLAQLAGMSFDDHVSLYRNMGMNKGEAESAAKRDRANFKARNSGGGGSNYPSLYVESVRPNSTALVPYVHGPRDASDRIYESGYKGFSGFARDFYDPTTQYMKWDRVGMPGGSFTDRLREQYYGDHTGYNPYQMGTETIRGGAMKAQLDKETERSMRDTHEPSFGRQLAGKTGSWVWGQASSGLGAFVSRLESFSRSINPLNALMDVFHSRFLKIAAVMGVAGGLSYMAHTGIHHAMDYQDNVTSLGIMMGSPAKGKSFVDRLQNFAAGSPFDQSTLFQSARTLSGYGVSNENLLPAIKAIGEITSASGGGSERYQRISLAFGQVMSKGFLKGEELRQFANAGVGVKAFADALDVSTAKLMIMMRQGEVGSDVLIKAFNKLTTEGGKFDGMMEKMMKNARGRVTFIENQFGLGLQSGGLRVLESLDKHGGFDILEGWATEFRKITEELGSWDDFGKAFSTVLISIRTGFEGIWELVKQVGDGLGNWTSESGESATTFEKIAGFIAVLPGVFKDVVTSIRAIVLEIKAFAFDLSDKTSGKGMFRDAAKGAMSGLPFTSGLFDNDSMTYAERARGKANVLWDQVGTGATSSFNDYWNNLNRYKRGEYVSPLVKGSINRQKALMGMVGGLVSQDDPFTVPQRLEKFFEGLEGHHDGSGHGFGAGGTHNIREFFQTTKDLFNYSQAGKQAKLRGLEDRLNDARQAEQAFDREHGGLPYYALPGAQDREGQKLMQDRTTLEADLKKLQAARFLGDEEFGAGAFGLLGNMRSHFKKSREVQMQPASPFLSVAAQDSINAARSNPGMNTEEEFKELFQNMLQELREQKDLEAEAGRALKALVAKDPKILAMPVNGK